MKIILIIDRMEGNQAILKTEDDENINWPQNKLPKNSKESDVLIFEIHNDKDIKNKKQNTAKDILNEILDA